MIQYDCSICGLENNDSKAHCFVKQTRLTMTMRKMENEGKKIQKCGGILCGINMSHISYE